MTREPPPPPDVMGTAVTGWKWPWEDWFKPKPDPWFENLMRDIERSWAVAAAKGFRRYKTDLQKRGKAARRRKAKRV